MYVLLDDYWNGSFVYKWDFFFFFMCIMYFIFNNIFIIILILKFRIKFIILINKRLLNRLCKFIIINI